MTLTSPEREEIKVLGELKYLCVPASGLFGSGSGTFSSMNLLNKVRTLLGSGRHEVNEEYDFFGDLLRFLEKFLKIRA